MNSANTLASKAISGLSQPAFVQDLLKSGAEVYLVGGPVRDQLLGRATKDLDILVRLLPIETLQNKLKAQGRIALVGKSFGILKFRPHTDPDIEYDIALPRKEVSTGLGHRDFDVDFDSQLPLAVDLQRRDFTINAMAINYQDGTLIDPLGGVADLEAQQLRQVHARAFEEDPLRLLRAIQFAARLNFTIEPETWEAMKRHAPLIRTVSAERIAEEIAKLLQATKPSVGFCLMRDCGLLAEVMPELQDCVGVEQGKKLHNDDVFMHTMRVLDASREDKAIPLAGDLELMFAALFHDLGKPQTKRFDKKKQRLTFYGHQYISRKLAEKRMRELKLSTLGIQPERVGDLVEHHMFQAKSFFTEKAIRRFIFSVGEDLILKLVDLRTADNRGGKYPEGIGGVQRLRQRIMKVLESKPALTIGDLAIDGHDLMTLGVPAGPLMGKILRSLVEVVLDEPEKNTKESLSALVLEQIHHVQETQQS